MIRDRCHQTKKGRNDPKYIKSELIRYFQSALSQIKILNAVPYPARITTDR